MFPWVYEFHWSAGHTIFLGTFFSVVTLIATTVVLALRRAAKAFAVQKAEDIQWEADFEDLPSAARFCRHVLTGKIRHRTCDNGFDCSSCNVHPLFLAKHNSELSKANVEPTVFGFNMPLNHRYHRGHTWVQNEGEGIYAIGLDDFARRVIGEPDAVELPKPGAHLHVNGRGWLMRKRNSTLRVLSPIDGEVIECGTPDGDWLIKVRGDGTEQATSHLLCCEEIRPWIMREFERFQISISNTGLGPALADGGELMRDIDEQFPQVDWEEVWGEMLLQA